MRQLSSLCSLNFSSLTFIVSTLSTLALSQYSTPLAAETLEPDVIYGVDNRRDVFDPNVPAGLAEVARSTALLTFKSQLSSSNNPGFKNFQMKSLTDTRNFCADEPFAKQPSAGWCSGFLAAPDVFVTAGHCITNASRCDETAIVFDFAYRTGRETFNSIPTDNVYYCKSIIAHKYEMPRGVDFAVIRLDRPVKNRQPLKMRQSGTIEPRASLALIGHPVGLPTKIADGAWVRDNNNPVYFITNTDSFGGNSGSAVVNIATKEVEGILVRGEMDFEYRGDCLASYRCSDTDCRGEDVTRAPLFVPYTRQTVVPTQPVVPQPGVNRNFGNVRPVPRYITPRPIPPRFPPRR